MFRPNRIGTPNILKNAFTGDTTAFTVNEGVLTDAAWYGNVFNANPVLDFGRSDVYWAGTARTLTASKRWCLFHQFTVTQPLAGDTVGIELNFSFVGHFSSGNIGMVPVIGKIASAGTTIWDAKQIAGPSIVPIIGRLVNNLAIQGGTYREQVIINDDPATVAGTYVHGFALYEATSTPTNITFDSLYAVASVRQLNDQQSIGYRDTLR